MILNKLATEYERLVEQGKLDRPGWVNAKIAYALELDEDGQLISVQPMRMTEEVAGKNGKVKTVTKPRIMAVPEQAKRASGIDPNFLCDNATYFLGIDNKDKPERTIDCFHAAGKLHHQILDPVDCEEAVAICRFFDTWNPAEAVSNLILKPYLDDIRKSGNLIFLIEDCFAQEIPEIKKAWQRRYDSGENDIVMQCLDSGKMEPVAILHPNIQGVRGAKSTGASLISFNARAYESYGRNESQGLNAPVSKYTTFAYGAALNYLLADRERVQLLGNTSMVCWADCGSPAYQDAFCQSINDTEVQSILQKLARGEPADLNGIPLGADEPFYILGLSPNAARVSVRFFLQGSFGDFARNVDAHYQRLEIDQPITAIGKRSVWGLLQETVNQSASDKTPSPQLSGDLIRAILTNSRYPETLLHAVEIRIRAERDINWRRAAILKAVLLQNYKNNDNYQEVATVKLNEQCNYTPYVLGRIFSQYECIQQWANPGINATIRDRYFNAAAATPAMVFGILGRLCQSHLKKLETPQRIFCEKELTRLYGMLNDQIPARLNLQDQATFQIGYYHATQARFTPKNNE